MHGNKEDEFIYMGGCLGGRNRFGAMTTKLTEIGEYLKSTLNPTMMMMMMMWMEAATNDNDGEWTRRPWRPLTHHGGCWRSYALTDGTNPDLGRLTSTVQ